MKTKQKPCDCDRLHFPHRRDTKCEEYDNSGDDLQAEFEADRFSAEFNRIFS